MVTVNKVVVRDQKCVGRKVKYNTLHDSKITPPCTDKQILTAIKQSYDVINCVVVDGTATILVRQKVEA